MNELARIRDTFNTVKYPSNVSSFPCSAICRAAFEGSKLFNLEHAYKASSADGQNKGKVVLHEFLGTESRLIWRMRRVVKRKCQPIIRRNCHADDIPVVAFDHHLHLESKLSVTAFAAHLWLFLKVLNLVQTLRVFSTRMEQPFMR